MAFKLASLFVEVSGKDSLLRGTLANAHSMLANFSAGIGSKLALAGAGVGLALAFRKGIMGAVDLNESLSKTNAILGEASPAVIKFADEMAEKFGLVKQTTLDAASAFAGLGKGLGGLHGDALSDFSIKLTKMAADLSSFANVGMAEASKAIQVGLSGEQSDTLKQLGVTLLEDQVKAQALAMGFREVGGQLTNQAKIAARTAIIMKGLADASGDLERTADQPANAIRKLTGSFQNLLIDIGGKFLPMVSAVSNSLAGMVGGIGDRFKANEGLFSSVGSGIIAVFDTLSEGGRRIGEALAGLPAVFESVFGSGTLDFIGEFASNFGTYLMDEISAVGSFVRNLPEYFELAALGITEAVMNLNDVWDSIVQNLAQIGVYVAVNWKELIVDGVHAIGSVFANLASNIDKLQFEIMSFLQGHGFNFEWQGLLTGFEATAAELPKMLDPVYQSLDAEQKAVWDKIEARDRAARERIAKASQPIGGTAGPSGPQQAVLNAQNQAPKLTGLAEFKQELALKQVQNPQVAATDKNTEATEKNTTLLEQVKEAYKANNPKAIFGI